MKNKIRIQNNTDGVDIREKCLGLDCWIEGDSVNERPKMKRNKSKHTPGPWTLDSDGYLWSPNDDQFEVAQVNVYNAKDAKLIAAAPELLEALEGLYKGDLMALPENERARRFVKAKEAIQKAKGNVK